MIYYKIIIYKGKIMRKIISKILSVALAVSCLFSAVACETPHEHVWGEWTVETPATCTDAGKEVRYCTGDASHKEERIIPAGHAWGAWQQVSAPTETTDGLKKRVCANDSTHVEERVLRTLKNKSIIFIGNSFTYYGNTVGVKTSTSAPTLAGRTNDKKYFYQLCITKGATVSVTNWTMDGHGLQDLLGPECGATNKDCCGDNHYANLTEKNYDYVVFQAGTRNSTESPEYFVEQLNEYMVDFKTANPNVKFVLLVQSQAHIKNYTWLPALKTLEEQGVIIADWGNVVYDIMNGTTKVPGSTMTYNKNSFIVAKSAEDGYHPNLLSGYITTLMTYCAITGDVAYGSEYYFTHNDSETYQGNIDKFYKQFYKVGDSNFREVLRSFDEMMGIQQVIDDYLSKKPYLNR